MKDEILAKITETLRGKTVKAVYYSRYSGNVEEDTPTSLEVDEGDIIIAFEDDTKLKVWNSEWGGIEIEEKEESESELQKLFKLLVEDATHQLLR
jgi:hypothetical protein